MSVLAWKKERLAKVSTPPVNLPPLPPPRAENAVIINRERVDLLVKHDFCVDVEVMSRDCERSVSWLFVDVAAANQCLEEMRQTPSLHRLWKRLRFGPTTKYAQMPRRAPHRLVSRINFKRPGDVKAMLRVVKLNT